MFDTLKLRILYNVFNHCIRPSVSIFLAARRLEVYKQEEDETMGRSHTLKSRASAKSLSCKSLSCNRSSVSLHTLTGHSEEEGEETPSPTLPRHSAFSSPMVRLIHPVFL